MPCDPEFLREWQRSHLSEHLYTTPHRPQPHMEELLVRLLGSRKFTPPPNQHSQVHVSRLLLPGAGAAAGPSSQGIGSSSPGSQRTEGAKQTARLPQEQSHSRGHTSWRCPLPGPQTCWQPRPMRLSHQAHSAAGFWPERVSISPHPRAPFLLTVSLGSLPGTQRSGCLQLLPRG